MNRSRRIVTLTLQPAIDRVVKIGELRPGATFDGTLQLAVPAGKGVNTARSLRALCDRQQRIVAAVWAGGADAQFFKSRLGESHIECAVCPRNVPTRQANTFLEAGGRETHIKELMPAPSAAEQAALLKFWKNLLRPNDIVATCGSAPKGTPPAVLKRIFAIARECGASLILADTNGRALAAAGSAGIDILKGNASEIGTWLKCGGAFDKANRIHLQCLRRALARPGAPANIVITQGADGVIFVSACEFLHCVLKPKIDPREIISVTGCGDAATAGILWGLLRNDTDPRTLLTCAAACGAVKLFSADPGKLSLKSVRRFVRYCVMNDIETP